MVSSHHTTYTTNTTTDTNADTVTVTETPLPGARTGGVMMPVSVLVLG